MMPKHRYTRQLWTRPQLYVLHRRYADTPTLQIAQQLGCTVHRVNAKAEALGLKKSAAYMARPFAYRRRPDHHTGGATRFKPGHVPANKGIKGWRPGGRSHETHFKPGQRGPNWVPIGTLRVNRDSYLDRKIADTRLVQHNWVPVHRLVWIEHHGPIPANHCVVFKAGRRTTDVTRITLDALELVSRAELMGRNTVHNLPKELAQLVQLRGALNRQIHKRERARP